jgi:hypothetical protein
MPLFIGEEYKLETTKYNVVLYCKQELDAIKSERMKVILRKRYGNDVKFKSEDETTPEAQKGWVAAGYFSNVGNALSYLINHVVELSNLKDVQTVVDVINKAQSNILKALSEFDSVKLDGVTKAEKGEDE